MSFETIARDWAAKVIVARKRLIPSHVELQERADSLHAETADLIDKLAPSAVAKIYRDEGRDGLPTADDVREMQIAIAREVSEHSSAMANVDETILTNLESIG